MFSFILRRVAGFIPVLFVIVSLSFFIMRLAPGGPFDQDRALPEQVKGNPFGAPRADPGQPLQLIDQVFQNR